MNLFATVLKSSYFPTLTIDANYWFVILGVYFFVWTGFFKFWGNGLTSYTFYGNLLSTTYNGWTGATKEGLEGWKVVLI